MPNCLFPQCMGAAGSLMYLEISPAMAMGSQAYWPRCWCRADELAGELAATKAELDQEVEDLRDVLNATLEDKAALAGQCSALEAQVSAGLLMDNSWSLEQPSPCSNRLSVPLMGGLRSMAPDVLNLCSNRSLRLIDVSLSVTLAGALAVAQPLVPQRRMCRGACAPAGKLHGGG